MIKTFFNIFIPATFFILLLGCSSSNTSAEFTFGVGKYNFTMSDSLGKKLIEGTLNVKTYSNNEISGTYEFTKVYNDKFDGYSTMDGQFGGEVNKAEKKVFINTNPRIADSNVFWNLVIKKNSLAGEWNYSAFRGKGSSGKVKVYR